MKKKTLTFFIIQKALRQFIRNNFKKKKFKKDIFISLHKQSK